MSILLGIVDFLLNKGTWFLICMIAIIVQSARLYKRSGRGLHPFAISWTFMTIVVIIIAFVLFVAITNVVFNNILRLPSRVDISPIASLDEPRLDHLEKALERLVREGYVGDVSIREYPGNQHRFSSSWISNSRRFHSHPPILGIGITVFNSDERALSRLQSTERFNPRSRLIQINSNSEALLIYPPMLTSAGGFYIPSNDRVIRSEIRIGNVLISLREERIWYDVHNNYSSRFIAVFIAALQEVES